MVWVGAIYSNVEHGTVGKKNPPVWRVGGARKVRSRCPATLAHQVDVTTELANVAADYWAALGYTSQCL